MRTAAGRAIMNKRIGTVVAAVLAAGIGGYAALLATKTPQDIQRISSGDGPVWTDAAWPFPIDQWGQGWAYQCKAADCGVEINVHLRPKIGFCNCQTGVADDEELDRVGDVDLLGSEISALGPGQPIEVHAMKGRSRSYAVRASSDKSAKTVLSLAFNDRCDVVVATVVAGTVVAGTVAAGTVAAGKEPLAHEQAVLEFLNGDLILSWVDVVLGR
jgi:hypothetical protein